jgi:hypothetical protein
MTETYKLQAALEVEEASGIALLHRLQQLSATQSKLPKDMPDTDARWVAHRASADAAQNDLSQCEVRKAFLKAHILVIQSLLLWRTAEQLKSANNE